MQTLEYRTIDKSTWPQGPWQNEPDKRQWRDEATGLPCLIVRGPMGALCGYVGVPNGHLYYGIDENEVPAHVHGGLTFADKCRPNSEMNGICHVVEAGESDDVWWLGFDCAHSGDAMPKMTFEYSLRQGTYRDFDYVTEEVKSLAAQLIAL